MRGTLAMLGINPLNVSNSGNCKVVIALGYFCNLPICNSFLCSSKVFKSVIVIVIVLGEHERTWPILFKDIANPHDIFYFC